MEQPKRKAIRLTEYDYAAPGAYFITICTQDRRCILSDVAVGADSIRPEPADKPIALRPYGEIVDQAVRRIPEHYPHISVDNYVIMPNHIHILLQIHADKSGRILSAPTISTVIGQMKRWASRHSGTPLWQKSFHEHVIRNEEDYRQIWQYIDTNPAKWAEDRYYMVLFQVRVSGRTTGAWSRDGGRMISAPTEEARTAPFPPGMAKTALFSLLLPFPTEAVVRLRRGPH